MKNAKQMNLVRATAVGLAIVVFSAVAVNTYAAGVPRQDKKVIEYGWDVPYLSDITSARMRSEMQKMPFDGVCFRIKSYYHAFNTKKWSKSDFPEDKLKSLHWTKFTDNFINLYATPASKDFSWYNDKGWNVILHNIKLISKAVKLSGSKGVVFDPEPYSRNPWKYDQKLYQGKSYKQVSKQARLRGKQFIEALQSSKADITFITLIARWKSTPDSEYALFPAFLKGMLEGAGPKVQIIDGDESSYYATSPSSYRWLCEHMPKRYRDNVSAKLQKKVKGQIHLAMAMYVDQVLSLRELPTTWQSPIQQYLPAQERVKLFGYQLYQALRYTDKYVWVYGEKIKWWPGIPRWKKIMTTRDFKNFDKDIKDWYAPQLPDGLTEVMRESIKRYKAGQPPKYDGLKLLAKAKKIKAEKEKAKAQSKKNNKSADSTD